MEVDNAAESAPGDQSRLSGARGESVAVEDQADQSMLKSERQRKY